MRRRSKKDDPFTWLERQVIRVIFIKIIKKLDKLMKGSWKTSLMGILSLLVAAALIGKAVLDGDPTTQPDFDALFAALAGLGLIAARDNNVTSKDAGAE